jgi:NAD(P)-dependent dehydrogenase (short-subunit alcohol dehydrogenase family)
MFGQRGARITSVSPGMIDTPMTRMEAEALGTDQIMVDLTPLHREGHADEVAAVVAFLLSEEATFVTGVDAPVDGGLVAQITSGSVSLTAED